MRVVIEPTAADVAERAAWIVARLVRFRPDASIALPTGRTPLLMYDELVRLHETAGLDFSRVTTFGLDEYRGLAGDDPRSFRSYLRRHFLDRVNVSPEKTHALDGLATDVAGECAAYEERIREAGGLDLALLGIGLEGHIGMNEPGSSLGSRTRLKTLTEHTARAAIGAFADADEVPRQALTMGVATILDARRCLLLATGRTKSAAVRHAVEGPLTSQVSASALQLHPDVQVILDEDAAADLARQAYYRAMELAQRALE